MTCTSCHFLPFWTPILSRLFFTFTHKHKEACMCNGYNKHNTGQRRYSCEERFSMPHHCDHYTVLCLKVQTDTSMLAGITLPNALYLFVNGQFHVLMYVK